MDVKLALVTNGSDIMLTVNVFVARMFSLVSLPLSRGVMHEMLTTGGWLETYNHSVRQSRRQKKHAVPSRRSYKLVLVSCARHLV